MLRPWRSDPAPATASAASLSPVAGGPRGVSGQAVVVRGPTGPELRVAARGLPLQQGYYEVWVFDGVANMVSLGVLGLNRHDMRILETYPELGRFPIMRRIFGETAAP